MIEDEDQVRLLEGGHRDADRVARRQRNGRLESSRRRRRRARRPRRPGTAGCSSRGRCGASAVKRRSASSGSGDLERLRREVRGEVVHAHRPALDRGRAAADGQQAPRAHAQERVAAQALAALDGLEQEGGAAVVEAHERADGGLEVGVAGGSQQDRVGRARELPDLLETERIADCHVVPVVPPVPALAPRGRGIKNPSSVGTKGCDSFRGATHIRPGRSLADGSGSRLSWRPGLVARASGDSRRSVLPFIAGALRRSLLPSPGSSGFGPEAHGSIRSRRRPSLHQPLVLYAGAGRYSSRSQPVFGCGAESRGSRGALSNRAIGRHQRATPIARPRAAPGPRWPEHRRR